MRLSEIVQFLDEFLEIGEWEDKSNNGLQVEGKEEVERIAFAVDACLEVFRRAKEKGADMVVVHHGLIWGGIDYVRGVVKERLKFLLENDMSLYAAHIPLDAHPKVGNNVQLLRLINAEPEGRFGKYKGKEIGFYGRFEKPVGIDELERKLKDRLGGRVTSLKFGKDRVERVGAVSGKGAFALIEAAEMGLDLFITGEAEHGAYHIAKEYGVNVIFAGHYLTETLGVKALMNVIAEEFTEVEVFFIDVPTGL